MMFSRNFSENFDVFYLSFFICFQLLTIKCISWYLCAQSFDKLFFIFIFLFVSLFAFFVCGMVDWWKCLSFISTLDHLRRYSQSQTQSQRGKDLSLHRTKAITTFNEDMSSDNDCTTIPQYFVKIHCTALLLFFTSTA